VENGKVASTSKLAATPSHVAVASAVRGWIALGTYAPGARLPGERELSERFGVGRMTVRRAMRDLAAERLVETTRGRAGGTVVLAEQPSTRAEAARDELLQAVHENVDFRLGLEPMAASLAASRVDDSVIAELDELIGEEPTSFSEYRSLDSRFHIAIAEASGNQLIAEAVGTARLHFFGWADMVYQPPLWDELTPAERDFGAQHKAVAAAIASGNPERARRVMIAHVRRGQDQYARLIETVYGRASGH
jgi:GntR family transcriptional repressor for pyruvate dehydrogenase complex